MLHAARKKATKCCLHILLCYLFMSGQKFLPWWVFIFNAVCTYKRVWGRTTNMMSTVLALQLVLFVSFHICYSNPTSSKPYTPLKSMLSFYKLCGIKKQFELVIMDLANQSFKKKCFKVSYCCLTIQHVFSYAVFQGMYFCFLIVFFVMLIYFFLCGRDWVLLALKSPPGNVQITWRE